MRPGTPPRPLPSAGAQRAPRERITSLPSTSTSPVTWPTRAAAAAPWRSGWTCRSRTHPRDPRPRRPRPPGRHHARRGSARGRAVGEVHVAKLENAVMSVPSRGSRIASSARPISVNASTTSDDADAGRQQVPPGADGGGAGDGGVVEHGPPGIPQGIAEAEEAQGGLGEDDDRHRQRGVGEAPSASRWAARAGSSGASRCRPAPARAPGRADLRSTASAPGSAAPCRASR